MAENTKAAPTRLSAREFLGALEHSGVLPDAKWREVRDRFVHMTDFDDSLNLAELLVEQGTLTEFQARRLLKGKKTLSLGRYALIDHVAKGARGRVFKARHRLMDRVVALKVLQPDGAISKNVVSRFFREMKIVGLLDHPHVVRAIDADVHDGCPFIVMEYLEGSDLEHVLARRWPLNPDTVVTYMAQAARGLAHAHEKGVIHRDIKPTNLFLLNTGIVKVLDLGFGELVGLTAQAGNIFDTDAGIVVGTTDFMSPEQVMDQEIDARTDLFSLGCTMYRLLTAKYAFPGKTQEDRLVKRIKHPHVPIADVRPGLSPNLIAVLDRLLAIRPEDRFASAALAAEALESLVREKADRVEREPRAKSGDEKPEPDVSAAAVEPEKPLDWSMIESALNPKRRGPRKASNLVEKNELKTPSSKDLISHRKNLEDEGADSGREVQKQYRNEIIQMKKALADLRSTEPTADSPEAAATRLERIGEWFGDFLAEPSAGQILIAVLAVLLALTMAFAFVAG
jgi:eukaryotic-like serine/threonine-protein kinase